MNWSTKFQYSYIYEMIRIIIRRHSAQYLVWLSMKLNNMYFIYFPFLMKYHCTVLHFFLPKFVLSTHTHTHCIFRMFFPRVAFRLKQEPIKPLIFYLERSSCGVSGARGSRRRSRRFYLFLFIYSKTFAVSIPLICMNWFGWLATGCI